MSRSEGRVQRTQIRSLAQPKVKISGLSAFGNALKTRVLRQIDSWSGTDRALTRSVRLDMRAASRISRPHVGLEPRHLLIPTVGMGNIGDQAMLEAFLRKTTLPVTLLVQFEDGHDIPAEARGRVDKVVIPELFGTRPWVRHRVRQTLASLVAEHSTVSVIGADVIDGSCGAAESAIRFGLLCMGNELGKPNRVLGCSWSGKAPAATISALGLSQPGTLLCFRDPHSLARARSEGDFDFRQVADTVFTLEGRQPYGPIEPWINGQQGRPIAIINVSGLLAARGLGTADYLKVARHLVDRGCSIVILPHVIRAGDDDLAACSDLYSQLGSNSRVYFVTELLNPGQVAWLAHHASTLLTGRMHLSILSLNQGIPAAILTTHGKVSGLLELFDLPELMLHPEPGFAHRAIDVLDRVLDDPLIRRRLVNRLPGVRDLADANFADLE